MTPTPPKLILVYNADGGLLNALRDSFHKTFAAQSYPCPLCALAFGFFTVKREWKRFLQRVPLEKVELHRDDHAARLPGLTLPLPVIALELPNGALKPMVTAQEMEAMERLDQLIGLSERRLAAAGIGLHPA